MKKKALWAVAAIVGSLFISACDKWDDELGQDVLPASDVVFVHHDTIFEISTYTASGNRIITSDHSYRDGYEPPNYFIGETSDSITGHTEASVFTQYNLTSGFKPGEETEIDSILLFLDMVNYSEDSETPITISVYEATERFYMDTAYYSDTDPVGKYDPRPLATYTYTPTDQDTIKILLNDGEGSKDFIDKWVAAAADTNLFVTDSAFRDHFNGFYITAEVPDGESMLAELDLNGNLSSLLVRFSNDSTQVPDEPGVEYSWANFTINQYYSQKINMFKHDYTGTHLADILDREDLEESQCYVQGFGGVNTCFSFDNLEEWMEGGLTSISSARLILDLPGEELTGIPVEELPPALYMDAELEDGSSQYIYDFAAQMNNLNGANFGGRLERNATSMFADTTYRYVFNLNLQFQSMVDGSSLVNDFRIQVNQPRYNYQISKLWSNLGTNPRRIRLEVVYLKL